MGFTYYQSIVQYRVNTDTGSVDILKKFTTQIGQPKKKKVIKKDLKSEEVKEEYM